MPIAFQFVLPCYHASCKFECSFKYRMSSFRLSLLSWFSSPLVLLGLRSSLQAFTHSIVIGYLNTIVCLLYLAKNELNIHLKREG